MGLHFLVLLLATFISASHLLVASYRNANPARDFEIVLTPVLFLNVTTPGYTGSTRSIGYSPSFGGTSLPPSSRADFGIDVPVMLPHVNDDIEGCGNPWNTTNEFGQSFSGAFVLIRQSQCTYTTYMMAAMSGAAGILAYGCPAAAPYNCNPRLKEIFVFTPINIPVIALSATDGEELVNFLQTNKNTIVGSGGIPSKNSLMITLTSTGPIVQVERQALISIMNISTMSLFASGTITDVLPIWSVERFSDMSLDPCRNYTKGIWCEGGHIVWISIFYHTFTNLDTTSLQPAFGSFSKLRYLNMQANFLSGKIPDSWCQLTDLRCLWLDTQYTPININALPSCMNAWSKMTELRMWELKLTTIPDALSTMTALKYIYLSKGAATNLPSISNLINLEEFDVNANYMVGSFPTPPVGAPLRIFSIGGNRFNGSLPIDAFDNMVQLDTVDLNSNSFTGQLPSFTNCPLLRLVDLSSQRDLVTDVGGFTGSMPPSWVNLKRLVSLQLQENRLVTPMYCSSMPALQSVDVSHNFLQSDPIASPLNPVGVVVNSLNGPSQVSIRASYNNLTGAFQTGSFLLTKSMRELFLDHNGITELTRELFVSLITRADFSYNNLSSEHVGFPISTPPADSTYFNLRGNPYYQFDTLPIWMEADDSRVQLPGTNFACAPMKSNSAPFQQILVDATFFKYQFCECEAGTFGRPPLCHSVPNSASLNPYTIITSDEVGSSLPTLIQQAGGIGSELTYTPNSTSSSPIIAQSFSDDMYGENRLTLGMATSWVIDLSEMYSDDSQSYLNNGLTPPTTPTVYIENLNSTISGLWTHVRVITIRLHISLEYFNSFDDVLSIFEGGSDLKGNRVYTLRGSDTITGMTYSDYASTSDYLQLYNSSLSALTHPILIEVRVFSPRATVQFTSRDTTGLHFFATYSYDFICPSGHFYDTDMSEPQCRLNRSQFQVGMGLRAVVFAISALAIVFVIFNIVMLKYKWESPVYKAASRPFLLLILIMLLCMALGSLLYAAIPHADTTTGSAICIGRAWLTCLPLVCILAVLLAKTNRLDSIFGATTLQVQQYTDMDILKIVLGVCSIQIVLLGIFSGLPLSRAILAVGHGSLSDTLVLSCSQESGFMSWFGAEIALIGCLIFPAAYLGFKTRDLPSEFNESTHIQNAVILLIFFGVIIIPLDIFIQDTPEAAVLIQGLGQSFLCITLTSIMFGPKLYFLHLRHVSEMRHQKGIQTKSYDTGIHGGGAGGDTNFVTGTKTVATHGHTPFSQQNQKSLAVRSPIAMPVARTKPTGSVLNSGLNSQNYSSRTPPQLSGIGGGASVTIGQGGASGRQSTQPQLASATQVKEVLPEVRMMSLTEKAACHQSILQYLAELEKSMGIASAQETGADEISGDVPVASPSMVMSTGPDGSIELQQIQIQTSGGSASSPVSSPSVQPPTAPAATAGGVPLARESSVSGHRVRLHLSGGVTTEFGHPQAPTFSTSAN